MQVQDLDCREGRIHCGTSCKWERGSEQNTSDLVGVIDQLINGWRLCFSSHRIKFDWWLTKTVSVDWEKGRKVQSKIRTLERAMLGNNTQKKIQ